MIWEVFENYLITLIIGAILGVLLTRYYYEKSRNYALGKTIEEAMISTSVEDLRDYCGELDLLLTKMRSESDNLLEQIKRCRDIENIAQKAPDSDDSLKTLSDGSQTEDVIEF